MALQTLSVDLEARLVKFTDDMGKAARVTERSAAQMSAALGVVKSSIAGLAAGITFGGLVSLTKNAIDSIDALNDLKDATGASIENISALEDVAARTGTSLDTVGGSLVKFNAALKDAKPDNDQGAAFKALNLNIKELQALDPAEALRRTAVALSQFADDGNKARLVQELFGKSVRETAPFLKDLAEQGALVAKVTTQQAEEAEKFNKELFNMQKNVQDLTRRLASDLVAGINKATEALKNSGLIEGLRTLFTGDDRYKNNKALTEQTEILLNLEKALQDQRGQGFAEDSRVVTNTKAQIAGIKEQIRITQNYRKVLDDFGGPVAGAPLPSIGGQSGSPTKGPTKPVKTVPAKEVKELDLSNKAVASYIDTLERNVQKTQDLSNQEQALLFLRKQGAGATLEQAAAVLNLAKALDAEAEQNERIRIGRQSVIDSGVDNSAYQARLKGLLDNTSSSRIQAVTDDVGLLQDELDAGRISLDQYVEAVQARIGFVGEEITKTKTFAEEMGVTFTSAFEDAIVGGKSFSQVLKGVQQDLLRIVIRKSITNPLGDFVSGALSSVFGGFFAGGGSPPLGKASIVGERGPEWFIPKTAGTIVPNGGMGAFAPTTQISVAGGMSKAEVYTAIQSALIARDRAWSDSLRAQGVIA